MPKGQLSRVPWPGNSGMLFTFQPALRVLQQLHKNIHTPAPASLSHSTKTSLRSICFMNTFRLLFFKSKKVFFKVLCGHIKALKWHLNGPLAIPKYTCLPSIILVASVGKVNRSTTPIYGM